MNPRAKIAAVAACALALAGCSQAQRQAAGSAVLTTIVTASSDPACQAALRALAAKQPTGPAGQACEVDATGQIIAAGVAILATPAPASSGPSPAAPVAVRVTPAAPAAGR